MNQKNQRDQTNQIDGIDQKAITCRLKTSKGARRIFTAAALTYLAASLASLLNLWLWIAFLRR